MLAAIFLVSFITADETETTTATTGDDRKPSMFKVNDEWLALPEVFSNLDFNAPNKPAADDGMMKLIIHCFLT